MDIPLRNMEYGKQYRIVFKDDPGEIEAEIVDPVRGQPGVPVRILKDTVFRGMDLKKGERYRLDPALAFHGTFLRTGKPIAKYSTQELLAKPTNLWRATIGEEYAFLFPRSAYSSSAFDPKKIFFATLLEWKELETMITAGRVYLKVKVSPEFAKAWDLDDPVLEWKSIEPPRMWQVPEKHAFARDLVLLNESMEPEFKLPLEMLGEIRKFQDPTWKPGAWPESYKQGRPQGDQGAASNAGRMGGRKSRRRRSTRRRRTTRT